MSEDPGQSSTGEVRFRTFAGVFRPTTLTILGAMLYLRVGWLVGNNGLLGAVLVILLAYAITGTTAASLASIATNTRMRAGGAFGIIAQALGLEVGGAIGLPLFIAQSASTALYLYAFTEGWAYIFPSHGPRWVVAVAFVLVAALAWRSASFAFKAQAIMLFVVVVALTSAGLGLFSNPVHTPTAIGAFADADLLTTFAVFFPASTGIMVGVGMSGSLVDPRKSVPYGTLAAWGLTLVVYLLGAVWYSLVAAPDALVADKTIMVDRALVGNLVLLGLLASTLMAALSTLVAAPRLLAAMAEQGMLPRSEWLARTDADGEPRRAMIITFGLAGLALLSGSLDAIAPIITSFFVLTYLAINGVVALEQRLGMISFRPTFQVPPSIPLIGTGLCALALVATSPGGGLVEVLFVVGVYAWLLGRRLQTPWETARSGIGVSVAAWAARRWGHAARSERAWKPDLLVPVWSAPSVRRLVPLIEAITHHNGSVKLVGIGASAELSVELDRARAHLEDRQYYTSRALVHASGWWEGTSGAIDALQGALFPPNLVVVDACERTSEELQAVVDRCRKLELGMVLLLQSEPPRDVRAARSVNVWLSDRSPDWSLGLRLANLDLPVLMGWLLTHYRGAQLRVLTTLRESANRPEAIGFLQQLVEVGRLPPETETTVLFGDFAEALQRAPEADVHVFGLPESIELERLRAIQRATDRPCIFLLDSGHESLLA